MVSFTPRLLKLWPDANQSATKAGVADKAEGIREIKLRWHAVIYIAIDLLLQQINHLFPSTAFLIFPCNSSHTITVPVVWCWMYGWEDMLVIALTLDVGSLWSNVVEVSDRRGLSSLSVGCSPKSWLIRLTGQCLDSTGFAKVMCANFLKDFSVCVFHCSHGFLVFVLICMFASTWLLGLRSK